MALVSLVQLFLSLLWTAHVNAIVYATYRTFWLANLLGCSPDSSSDTYLLSVMNCDRVEILAVGDDDKVLCNVLAGSTIVCEADKSRYDQGLISFSAIAFSCSGDSEEDILPRLFASTSSVRCYNSGGNIAAQSISLDVYDRVARKFSVPQQRTQVCETSGLDVSRSFEDGQCIGTFGCSPFFTNTRYCDGYIPYITMEQKSLSSRYIGGAPTVPMDTATPSPTTAPVVPTIPPTTPAPTPAPVPRPRPRPPTGIERPRPPTGIERPRPPTGVERPSPPTERPTPTRVEESECRVDARYENGVLHLSFDMGMSEPQQDDWIGLYPCNAQTLIANQDWNARVPNEDVFAIGYNFDELYVNEEAIWMTWTCGDPGSGCARREMTRSDQWPARGEVSLDPANAGAASWAFSGTMSLESGCYAVLMNREAYISAPPYPAICKGWSQADQFYVP